MFEVQILERPKSLILSSDEEIIISLTVPNSESVINNSMVFPIENLIRIERPLILSPGELVARRNCLRSRSRLFELNSHSIIELVVLGKQVGSGFQDNILEVIGRLVAGVKVVVIKS